MKVPKRNHSSLAIYLGKKGSNYTFKKSKGGILEKMKEISIKFDLTRIKCSKLNKIPVQYIRPVLLIETVHLGVKTFWKSKTSTLNRKPVQLIRPVLLIEQYL